MAVPNTRLNSCVDIIEDSTINLQTKSQRERESLRRNAGRSRNQESRLSKKGTPSGRGKQNKSHQDQRWAVKKKTLKQNDQKPGRNSGSPGKGQPAGGEGRQVEELLPEAEKKNENTPTAGRRGGGGGGESKRGTKRGPGLTSDVLELEGQKKGGGGKTDILTKGTRGL